MNRLFVSDLSQLIKNVKNRAIDPEESIGSRSIVGQDSDN